MSALLLDTCAAIWLTEGQPMSAEALAAIDQAVAERSLWLSPITAWETALKLANRRPAAPRIGNSAAQWYLRLAGLPGVREAPLTGAIALRSTSLPPIHRDPADRFLIATALEIDATLVTRDRRIFDYGDAGVISILAC